MPVLTDDLRARVAAWVEAGGVLVLGPLTGYRSEEFTAFKDREFGGLEELMGGSCAVRFSPMWVEDEIEVAFSDGHACHPRIWCDGFAPEGAVTLATYEGGWGNGSVAMMAHEYGKGTVITLGTLVDEPTWLKLVDRALAIAGVAKVAAGSPEVLVVPRVDAAGATVGYGVVNSVKTPQTVTLPAPGHDRLTGDKVGPEITLEPMQYMLVELD
jgi:beta-galactosidase GanA